MLKVWRKRESAETAPSVADTATPRQVRGMFIVERRGVEVGVIRNNTFVSGIWRLEELETA